MASPKIPPQSDRAWQDISVPLKTGMVHWPGDPRTTVSRVLDLERGDPCTISHLRTGAHAGTHMDAPAHFIPGGATLDGMPLDASVGPARVIAIDDPEAITPKELARHRIRPGQRLLFKTLNSDRCWATNDFIEDFVHITVEAALYLAKRNVRLVGIDYLSVGGFHADGAAVHRILLEAGIWIIEGLNMSHIQPGRVDLVCLPIKLEGAEGAPARAIVRPR